MRVASAADPSHEDQCEGPTRSAPGIPEGSSQGLQTRKECTGKIDQRHAVKFERTGLQPRPGRNFSIEAAPARYRAPRTSIEEPIMRPTTHPTLPWRTRRASPHVVIDEMDVLATRIAGMARIGKCGSTIGRRSRQCLAMRSRRASLVDFDGAGRGAGSRPAHPCTYCSGSSLFTQHGRTGEAV